jgi:hypothetical protein
MGWRDDVRKALKELKAEERTLEAQLSRVRHTADDLRRQLAGPGPTETRSMSPEARAKISAAQKKRWRQQRETSKDNET